MFDRLTAAFQEVDEALADLDPNTLIGGQPAEGLRLLNRHERAVAAARLGFTRRAEEMRHWQREGYRSYEDWLAATNGTSHTQAKKQARTAKNLADHDRTAKALADGDISEDEADVVADAANKNPTAEKELLDTAKNKGKSHTDLKDQAAKAKAAGETEQARSDRLRRGRRGGWGPDREGFWGLHGKHEPQVGAAMQTILDAEVDRITRTARGHGIREPFERYRADAIANLILGRTPGTTNTTTPSPTTDTDTGTGSTDAHTSNGTGSTESGGSAPDRTAAAGRSARATGKGHRPGDADPAAPDNGQLGLSLDDHRPRDPGPGADTDSVESDPVEGDISRFGPSGVTRVNKQLIVIVDLEALRRGCVNPGETCHIDNVGQVPVEVARRWADDAFVKAVIRDGTDIRTVTHLGRHIPEVVRTALVVTDNTCAVPGCSNRRIEYDHEQPHADHGPCSTTNLRPLCVHHHRQRTHHGYELTGEPGNRQWTHPDGRVLFADDPDKIRQPARAP